MSTHLLPVKTGNEQFPVRYRNIHPAGVEIYSSVTTEKDKMMYIGASTRNYNGHGEFLFYKMNLLTSRFETVGEISWNDIGQRYVGSILADDEYLYISSIDRAQILIFKLDTLAYIGLYQYSTSAFQAYGKMDWLNDTTICIAYSNGFLFFDTKSRTYSFEQYSTSYSYCDMAVGKRLIVANKGSSSANSVVAYRMDERSFFTFSLTTNDIAVSCYKDGKFYMANTQYLYIYDEETETFETINVPWTNPRTISYTNGTVFVTCRNSTRLYIYNIERKEYRYIILPWTIRDFSNSYATVPTAFEGYFFIEYLTFGIIDYSGDSKYNFGYKYDVLTLLFNKENQSQFTFDPRFITFHESYMTMHNGDIMYPFNTIDQANHIKSTKIRKSDYKSFIRASLKHMQGDDDST